MKKNIIVGISDYQVARSPHILITYALGSCVGTAVFDKENRIGGLSHILLHDSTLFQNTEVKKYADTAIPAMVSKLLAYGAKKENLVAYIAGGAQTLIKPAALYYEIGNSNIQAVRQALQKLSIPILAEEVGGFAGRTMSLDLESLQINIKTVKC